MEEQTETVEVQHTHPAGPPPAIHPVTQIAGAEATLGQRIGGFLIDCLVAIVISIVVGKISTALSFFASSAYWVVRDSLPFLGGQSLGKKVAKTQAVTEDGQSLSGNWNNAVIRNIVLVIPFFALVELIVLIVNKDKPGGLRRLGDQWGKTKVVKVG